MGRITLTCQWECPEAQEWYLLSFLWLFLSLVLCFVFSTAHIPCPHFYTVGVHLGPGPHILHACPSPLLIPISTWLILYICNVFANFLCCPAIFSFFNLNPVLWFPASQPNSLSLFSPCFKGSIHSWILLSRCYLKLPSQYFFSNTCYIILLLKLSLPSFM